MTTLRATWTTWVLAAGVLAACSEERGGIILPDDEEEKNHSHPPPAMEAGSDASPSPDGASPDAAVAPECVYHSASFPDPAPPPPPRPDTGDASDAGVSAEPPMPEGGPVPSVLVEDSAFLGPYLTDSTGLALYIYGADLPGDCAHAPVMNCEGDCLIAWPPFNAGVRDLAEGLDDRVFGTIELPDGTHQTTFYGWPLYYYKRDIDEAAEIPTGHGRGVWFAAELPLPNVLVMRTPSSAGGVKYLADERGRTLYVFDADVAGDGTTPPQSVCEGECLSRFTPFSPNPVVPVSIFDPAEFTTFVRADGSFQVAYRGRPLYRAAADVRSGDMNGTLTPGWTTVEYD